METLNELITAFVAAVWAREMVVIIEHSGEPARYVARDPEGACHVIIATDGMRLHIPRSFRLIVQPIDQVMLHAPCCEAQRWSTV